MEIGAILVSFLAPIIAVFLPVWFSRPRHAIRWVVLPPKSMMEIADEISGRLNTTFDGRPVRNLTKFSFILHNSGREPLDADSIVEPLKWIGPGTIFDARVVTTMPEVKLDIRLSNRDMEVSWALFNQSCQAFIEVICESESESDGGNITGQIKKVPEIKVKDINHFDEEEIRKRIRKNISRSPRIFRYLNLENMSIYSLRYFRQLGALYLAVFLGMLGFTISEYLLEFQIKIDALIGISFAASVMLLFLYLVRNPYSKLLRSRSQHSA